MDALTHWLALERLEYERLDERWAVVRLLATLDCGRGAPAGTALVVQHGDVETTHRAFYSVTDERRAADETQPAGGPLWRVSFGVPIEVVEFEHALFKLTGQGGLALALPTPARRCSLDLPALEILAPGSDAIEARLWTRHVRRHLTALATGVAVVTASAPAAATGTTTAAPTSVATTTPPAAVTPAPASTPHVTTPAPKLPVSSTSTTTLRQVPNQRCRPRLQPRFPHPPGQAHRQPTARP